MSFWNMLQTNLSYKISRGMYISNYGEFSKVVNGNGPFWQILAKCIISFLVGLYFSCSAPDEFLEILKQVKFSLKIQSGKFMTNYICFFFNGDENGPFWHWLSSCNFMNLSSVLPMRLCFVFFFFKFYRISGVDTNKLFHYRLLAFFESFGIPISMDMNGIN